MSGKRTRICGVLSCQNTSINYDGPFFWFPKDPKRYESWVENLGALKHSKVQFVCRDHFDDKSFVDTFRNRLHRHSVPRKVSEEKLPSHELLTTDEMPTSHEKFTIDEKPTLEGMLTTDETFATYDRIFQLGEATNCVGKVSNSPLTPVKRTVTCSNDEETSAANNEQFNKILKVQHNKSSPKSHSKKSLAMVISRLKRKKYPNLFLLQRK